MPTANRGHERGRSALSRYAAPPTKKYAVPWTLLALAAIGFLVASDASAKLGTWGIGLVAVAAAALAARAVRYNAHIYPELQKLWAHSFMCARCGEIFFQSDDVRPSPER